ncbi:MAG: FAD-dependent oxidoreductase [Saprospiraceae bacterium]|nr:FAD-dependent oxidoreductase [Saprospiraceae bacterium]
MISRFFLNFLFPFIFIFYNINAEEYYDIVVYGGTSAGVIAAVQAAKMGKNVALISTDEHIGGLVSSGLGATDLNIREAIGGLAKEFYSRVYRYYLNPYAWNYTTPESYFEVENNRYYGNNKIKRVWGGKNDDLEIMWVFEPHVAKNIFKDMLLESGVKVIYNERLDLNKKTTNEGNVIKSIIMESGRKVSGGIFIDATYEGDLMAKAGVSYTVGRESNNQYNETWNGVLRTGLLGVDFNTGNSEVSIDPFIIEGDSASGLLPFIDSGPPGPDGSADNRIQAYTYRFTLSNNLRNFKTIEKPSNYNPLWFEHYARVFKNNPCIDLLKTITVTPLPNKKTDINHCDFVGINSAWPEGNYKTRDSIAQLHKDYALGKVWFLQHDPRVPVHIRKIMEEYGLPRDEFISNQNFPPQIYVREARRMISDYVMTEHNVMGTIIAPESIALGTYSMDSHVVTHFIDDKNRVWLEGAFFTPNGGIYPISYQSIRPKIKECANLLVPVCLSATHIAYGSIRMEPQYMVMGQSAAVAACIALDEGLPVQKIQYEKLKNELRRNGQITDISQVK